MCQENHITNRPSLVNTLTNVPSIFDHKGTILIESDIVPVDTKKRPCKNSTFVRANWSKMKENVSTFSTSFVEKLCKSTVDETVRKSWTTSRTSWRQWRSTYFHTMSPGTTPTLDLAQHQEENTKEASTVQESQRRNGNPDHVTVFQEHNSDQRRGEEGQSSLGHRACVVWTWGWQNKAFLQIYQIYEDGPHRSVGPHGGKH